MSDLFYAVINFGLGGIWTGRWADINHEDRDIRAEGAQYQHHIAAPFHP
jgi:hypothetical protein